MNYLGITWGHPSGAALISDERLRVAVSEERFSRQKNDMQFPQKSMDYAIAAAGGKEGLSAVGVATERPSYAWTYLQHTRFSVQDMVREQHLYWYPRLYEGKDVNVCEALKDKLVTDQYPREYWGAYDPGKELTFAEDSRQMIADYAGIDPAKVTRIEHHRCHALYAYYASPYRDGSVLVVTIDGHGDGLNATVAIAKNGEPERILATDKCVIGRIYSHVTLLMGMKRLEHEYKVMGLAPYAQERRAKEVAETLFSILDVDGIDFCSRTPPKDSYFYFQRLLEGFRFDHIAGGLQLWVESLLSRWIANIVRHTNCGTVVLSGGVSMNVKAMGIIARLPEVERIYIPGSGADDSLCIGAAMAAALDHETNCSITVPSLYVGPSVEDDDARSVIASCEANPDYLVIHSDDADLVAQLLAAGLVIGRCVGPMEFGQRSLGNRAILADPVVPGLVDRINAMIKQRDFWMPFAPVVLDTAVADYLVNPDHIESPHMTFAFETTDVGYSAMKASCHPADRTARAQILNERDNPPLYAILQAFETRTGRSALLNTSFNLHGSPIVRTAVEACEVFVNSELECLLLPGAVIAKASCRNTLHELGLVT